MPTINVECAAIQVGINFPNEFNSIIKLLYPDGQLISDENVYNGFVIKHANGNYSLFQDNINLASGLSRDECAIHLMNEVIRQFAEHYNQHISLHAGAVVKDNFSIIIPAPSGFGKTSLCAWFCAHGFDYLSDELILFASGSGQFFSLYRPLNIKHTGLDALKPYRLQNQQAITISTPTIEVWPAQLLGNRGCGRLPIQANLFIFPEYQQQSEFKIEKLTPAQTSLQIMKCNVNARNLNQHGFLDAINLAKCIPGISLSYGDFNQLEGFIDLLKEFHTY